MSTKAVEPRSAHLDVKALANQLGVSVATIYRKRSLGEPLPLAFRVGHQVRWRQEVVDAWVGEQERIAAQSVR
jgi:predicted DNA-binding transcriptional regulator AlpA